MKLRNFKAPSISEHSFIDFKDQSSHYNYWAVFHKLFRLLKRRYNNGEVSFWRNRQQIAFNGRLIVVREKRRGSKIVGFMSIDEVSADIYYMQSFVEHRGYGTMMLQWLFERFSWDVVQVHDPLPEAEYFWRKMADRFPILLAYSE